MARLALALAGWAAIGVAGAAATEYEPRLALAQPDAAVRTVALTLDACSGGTDRRVLDALVETGTKATIFVTGRWLKRNQSTLDELKRHPDLFEIENHGANHVPAVTDAATVFGIPGAQTIEGVRAEVEGGAAAVEKATGARPRWYRGATARYSRDALDLIAASGQKVAGFSLNADMGASLPADAVRRRIAAAKSGDVLIAHINQPTRSAGQGVADGIRALAASGVRFVRLDEVETRANDGAPLLAARREVKDKLHVQRDDDKRDQGREGGHPARSDELTHLGAARGEPDQRNDSEGKLKAQDDLAKH